MRKPQCSYRLKFLNWLKKMDHPYKIQSWLEKMTYSTHDEVYSAEESFFRQSAHCFEGALLAAAALEFHGHRPALLDLRGHGDDDHVVCLFRLKSGWGAISKTNTTMLSFRPPYYASVRELAMSYWGLYFNWQQVYAMYDFGGPFYFDQKPFNDFDWRRGHEDLTGLTFAIDKLRHQLIIPKRELSRLPKVPKRLREACFLKSDMRGVRQD
jgi:hypothetical protein